MTLRARVRVRVRGLSAVASVLLMSFASVLVSGCTSARNALGTNSSPCYLALPVAKDAVHGRGRFVGVRLVKASELATKVLVLRALTARSGGKLGDVCVVAYSGHYTLSQVESPLGRAPATGVGRYAIVVVDRSSNKLLATVVRNKEPEPFRHVT